MNVKRKDRQTRSLLSVNISVTMLYYLRGLLYKCPQPSSDEELPQWLNGPMALWLYGSMALWLYGSMEKLNMLKREDFKGYEERDTGIDIRDCASRARLRVG